VADVPERLRQECQQFGIKGPGVLEKAQLADGWFH
jgi:hypothetical protein